MVTVRTHLAAIQARRFDLYELMLEVNDIPAGALHAVLAESQAVIQYLDEGAA